MAVTPARCAECPGEDMIRLLLATLICALIGHRPRPNPDGTHYCPRDQRLWTAGAWAAMKEK